MTTTTTPTLSPWTNPRTGEVRYYLNNWEALAGIEVTRYNTGNVSSFHINGEKVANSRYGNYGGKIWVSEAGEVNIDLSNAYHNTAAIDVEKLQADLRTAALDLWNAKHAPKAEEAEEETTTTAELFDKLAMNQAVLDTDVRKEGTNEERFYLHLINGHTVQFEIDGNEFSTTMWKKWNEEDEENFNLQWSVPLDEAAKWIRHLAQGDFTVRFTEDAENTPSGQTRQYAEVTNEAGDEIGWFDWLTDNPEDFEPELYEKAAREFGWELAEVTPRGGIAHLTR